MSKQIEFRDDSDTALVAIGGREFRVGVDDLRFAKEQADRRHTESFASLWSRMDEAEQLRFRADWPEREPWPDDGAKFVALDRGEYWADLAKEFASAGVEGCTRAQAVKLRGWVEDQVAAAGKDTATG